MTHVDDATEVQAVKLNNELLAAAKPTEPKTPDEKPKRNSKEDLMAKLHKIADQYELDFPYSDTRLKRMNKTELMKLLSKYVEEGVKCDMARAVGVDPRANGKTMSLAALRMAHNIFASTFERGFNYCGPRYGYEMVGFTRGLQDPTVQQSIDECLAEIARESPEILEYFESPYARLALVWFGVAMTTIQQKNLNTNINYNPNTKRGNVKFAPRVGPRENTRPTTSSIGNSGSPPVGQEHGRSASRVLDV